MKKNLPARGYVTAALTLILSSGVLTPLQADAQVVSRYVKVDGLASGQVLWIRSGPGLGFKRIGFLPSTARHIRNFGCRQVATGTWCEVRYRRARGWASRRFLAADGGRRA